MKKQTFTPEQKEQARLYAASYRAKNPTLPKTPEQMEKRRLWQIEYRKNNPPPKQTEEQKAKRAERQKEFRENQKRINKLAKDEWLKLQQEKVNEKAARIEAKKVLRQQLQAEKEEARRLYHERKLLTADDRKKEYNQKQRDKYHQRKKELGIVNKKSEPVPQYKLKPMTVHTPKVIAKALPTRTIDLSKCIPLQLDHKTLIYIRKDQDPEVIRQRFLNRRG